MQQHKKKIFDNKIDGEYSLELRLYLQQSNLDDIKSCPFESYWSTQSNKLQKVAIKYLSTVGSSVPCERLFSKAGHIMTESRNRLDGERFSKFVFLSSLNESDWQL